MKGTHKVGNTINSNSDVKYHINNVIPVWYANFHLPSYLCSTNEMKANGWISW
jgi:hypothetical protein